MESTLVFLPGESVDRGAWRATVHGVTTSQTRLKQFSMHTGTGDHVHRDVFFDLPSYLKKINCFNNSEIINNLDT